MLLIVQLLTVFQTTWFLNLNYSLVSVKEIPKIPTVNACCCAITPTIYHIHNLPSLFKWTFI